MVQQRIKNCGGHSSLPSCSAWTGEGARPHTGQLFHSGDRCFYGINVGPYVFSVRRGARAGGGF